MLEEHIFGHRGVNIALFLEVQISPEWYLSVVQDFVLHLCLSFEDVAPQIGALALTRSMMSCVDAWK